MTHKYDCFLSNIKSKQNYFYKNKNINFKRTSWLRSRGLEPVVHFHF